MGALERAEQDEREGDLGSARRRLASYIGTNYSPEVAERLGRICWRMHDPVEAGRWYYLSDSADPQAADAIRRFEAFCGGSPHQVRGQAPAVLRTLDPERFPPAVRERMKEMGVLTRAEAAQEVQTKRWKERAALVGCLLVVLAGIMTGAIGAVTIAGWFRRALD